MRIIAVIAVVLFACGNKSKEDSPAPTPVATSGADSPRAALLNIKNGLSKGDFKLALSMVREHERAGFVGLAYLEVAMPVLNKQTTDQTLSRAYAAINRKHNLVIDEAELKRLAGGRLLSDLSDYFTRVFKGNDLVALWTDIHAAVPKQRNIWPHVEVGSAEVEGDRAKVNLWMKKLDTSARFDVIRERGRWYFDVGAFGRNQKPPTGAP